MAVSISTDIRDVWRSHPGEFAKAACTGAGFSFKCDGKLVGPDFFGEWHQSVIDEPTTCLTQIVFAHDSGLVVRREMRVLPEFGAIEYKVYLKNTATETLPAVSDIHALDLSFGKAVVDRTCVIASGGGLNDGFLPPRNFAIRKHCFGSMSEFGSVELTTEGGRSSNKDLPFFFVHNEARQEGLFVGVGWSGQWRAEVTFHPAKDTLRVSGKIPDLEIALEPGEEIQGPTMLVGLYQGALMDGANRLRRLIRDVYTPKLSGRRFLPIATYDHWWNIYDNFDESLLKKLTDSAAAVGQEYFLLDAGWYAYSGTEKDTELGFRFSTGLGNWYEIDKRKLPNGLKPVADHVRLKGLKFGLWFEPERVAPSSTLAQEHRDWVLWEREREPESLLHELNKGYGLLNYGLPEVQQWVREMMDHYIREYGVRYIRYDFNIDPLPYWDANDKPNRRGVTQLRHIQGFYAVIDWLRERHPDVVLEGCSSGGRRIDFETARKFHTFWISDHSVYPSIIRYHLFGINYFLPGNYHYVQYTLPFGSPPATRFPSEKEFQPDDLGFQSLFGGAFGIGGRVDLWPEAMKQKTLLHVQTWKKIRHYLMEDYYPLSPQPADMESWSGWQFHVPKDQSGFVQTFRTNTPNAVHRFAVHGLDEGARYRFTDAYGGQSFEVTGSVAMKQGIEVTQERMSSRVFMYKHVSQ